MNDDAKTNELIIELANLNDKLNSKNKDSNVKLTFAGITDDRDEIIEKILFDEKINKKCEMQAVLMNNYYREIYGSNIDFRDIVFFLMRILLKNFKLFDGIDSPKGFLISYCFNQKAGSFQNRLWAYLSKYNQRFEEFKGHKSLDQILENQRYDIHDADYFESNKCWIDIIEAGANSKFDQSNINDNSEATDDLDNIDEEELLYYENEDKDTFLFPELESFPTLVNSIITKYDISFEELRIKNIELTDEEYSKKINDSRKNKIKKWHIYNAETGYFPCNITKYQEGINHFLLRDNSDERDKIKENKDTDLIFAVCQPERVFDFSEISFDRTIKNYLRKIITDNLSERQQMLIKYLYFEMMPADDVVRLMGYTDKTAMNKEKSRSLILLKYQILSDFDYIIAEYGDTKLAYWAKKIKQRHEKNICEKKGKNVI